MWQQGLSVAAIAQQLGGVSHKVVSTRVSRLRKRGWQLERRKAQGPPSPVAIGDRFGRLVVIASCATRTKHGFRQWECECDCGAAVVLSTNSLRTGHTTSCGCWNRERSAQQVRERSRTHGYASRSDRSPVYSVWATMIQRCTNPNASSWQWYGARGISVCDRWRFFENFLEDLGEPPTGTSIERVNNDGNYEPSNCRWATSTEQAANKRTSPKHLAPSVVAEIHHRYASGDVTQYELAEMFGVTQGAISYHVKQPTPALPRTHCPHGHPFDSDNTYEGKNGRRACRACNRVRAQATRAAARQLAPK
jgi:hypothetical protein